MNKHSHVQLTWSGFDAAIDLIAAQCNRGESIGVYSGTSAGTMLAIPLADRLRLPVLEAPKDKMLLVDAHVADWLFAEFSHRWEVADAWVWIDTSMSSSYNAVCRLAGVASVAMPWQDAMIDCCQSFIPTFHD
jgi:xanthine phosphoribosyltransferase